MKFNKLKNLVLKRGKIFNHYVYAQNEVIFVIKIQEKGKKIYSGVYLYEPLSPKNELLLAHANIGPETTVNLNTPPS